MPRVRAITSLALGVVVAACGGGSPTTAPGTVAPQSPAATTPPSVTAGSTAGSTGSPTAAPLPALAGERITFRSGDLTLGGMLWKPAGNGPFRAVLWNHGSEKGPGADGSNPLLGPVFAARGYVFFMPFRRGQGTSEGTWIVDATKAAPAADQAELIARLHTTEQLSDQLAGLMYLRSLAYVDDSNVGVAGWSYGGIQTVLGAGDASAGYHAAVAFTPASQAWAGNPDLQKAMLDAATAADIPFLFIQAENDYSLVPTQELTETIVAGDGSATRSIYPAFGSTNQDGHEFAVRGFDAWGAEVFAFLAAAFGG